MLCNLWQFYISILYLLVNNLITTLLLAAEWDGYIKNKKSLRVSHPRGIQRSSFFLSMPWRYGIPLIGSMALWHFCVSQSVFVTRLSQYLSNGEISPGTEWISSIYSSNAVIACKLDFTFSNPFVSSTTDSSSSFPSHYYYHVSDTHWPPPLQ